jgi:hypothetical protein
MRRSALVVLAASVALAGCAGGREPDESGRPAAGGADLTAEAERRLADELAHRDPAPPVPEGFRLRRVSEAGLALALPPHWQALRTHDARFPGMIRALGDLNDQLGFLARALAQPDSPLKLVGFDTRFRDGFATHLTLVQSPADPGVSFERWSSSLLAEIRALPSTRGAVVAHRVNLPYGEALRLDYAKGGGADDRLFATVQYVLLTHDQETIVTFITLPRLKSGYAREFERSVRTLRTS